MAEAISKERWSDAEVHAERLHYWEYLQNEWLVPSPSLVTEQPFEASERRVASPSRQALAEYGWLKEPEHILEH